jgi:hypothetical protein
LSSELSPFLERKPVLQRKPVTFTDHISQPSFHLDGPWVVHGGLSASWPLCVGCLGRMDHEKNL